MTHSKAGQKSETSVSVVVLAFNEARNLPATIQSIHQAIADKFSQYEIQGKEVAIKTIQ